MKMTRRDQIELPLFLVLLFGGWGLLLGGVFLVVYEMIRGAEQQAK